MDRIIHLTCPSPLNRVYWNKYMRENLKKFHDCELLVFLSDHINYNLEKIIALLTFIWYTMKLFLLLIFQMLLLQTFYFDMFPSAV